MCGSEPHQNGDSEKHPQIIERARFEKLLAQLLESRTKDRAKIRGLDDQRKDQIVAGAILVGELFRRLHLKRIEICPSALREGILLEYLSRHICPTWRSAASFPTRAGAASSTSPAAAIGTRPTASRWPKSASNSSTNSASLHGMSAAERELIEYGALLHDIGWHIGRDSHHKHSMYLILHGDLKNFSDDEVKVIANIARYHRKAPKDKHDPYATLPSRWRRVVDVGAALLRLSDGLDRSHSSVIQDLRCKIDDKKVKCTLTARSDAELEIWGARRKRTGSRKSSAARSFPSSWPGNSKWIRS
jgi:exopolyphosphatase / guanosine-5'-triphosphate,3'-diphosphate pyrophosphatase